MSARRRLLSLAAELRRDDPMDPSRMLAARINALPRKQRRRFGESFGIRAFFPHRIGRRERDLWYRGEHVEPHRRRVIRERRQRECVHRWVGGGRTWTEYGYEYEAPTCERCGAGWSA